MTDDRIRLLALAILAAIALAGLGATTWLLAAGVDTEASLAVLPVSTAAGGAIAGALTLGRQT